jgi:hypothetical protein
MEPRPDDREAEFARRAADAAAAMIAGGAGAPAPDAPGAPGAPDVPGTRDAAVDASAPAEAAARTTSQGARDGGPSARAGEAGDGELESVLRAVADGETSPTRLAMDSEGVRRGLGRLVLVVVRLIHELMEREGLRRIDSSSLSEEDIERLGLTLMRQAEEIERLREHFGLEPEDMQLDLGPLGRMF